MRAPLSIIIPTLDAGATIGPVLASLTPGLQAGLIRELVISDGGSTDGTAAIADQAGARLLTGPAGRGGQLAAGAAAARGQWLLFLHADSCLAPDWPAVVLAHIASHPGEAGWFRLSFDEPGLRPRLVAGWANLRARLLGLPFGDQGLLVPRALYAAVGGYPDLPLMEDVTLARRLAGRLRPLAAAVRTSAARYRRQGWLRRGWANQMLLLRWRLGADPRRLAEDYRRG